MTTDDEDNLDAAPGSNPEPGEVAFAGPEHDDADGELPTQLGARKYVQAAFFGAGILVAFLAGKLLSSLWNHLAEWPLATRALPVLQRYAEDERPHFTMVLGLLFAIFFVLRFYRDERTSGWADEVAAELSKVVWPTKDTVSNGTVVVIIASAIATVYVTLLDRFWGFLTTLVYG